MCKLLRSRESNQADDCKTLRAVLGIVYAPLAILGGVAAVVAS